MKRILSYSKKNFVRLKKSILDFYFQTKSFILNIQKNKNYSITLMVIPHDDKNLKKFHINYFKFFIYLSSFFILLAVFVFVLLNQSANVNEIEELKLSNEDYLILEKELNEELASFHKESKPFYEKIFRLYEKLGGKEILFHSTEDEVVKDILNKNSEIKTETYSFNSDMYNLQKSIELTKEIIKSIKVRKDVIKNTPSLWPTKGYILSPFGKFYSPLYGREIENKGIDIGAFAGSEVISTAPGEVYEIGYTDYLGYYLKINHSFGWKTIYSNLERLQVKQNDIVTKGQTLGYVTKTSSNSIYFLHYEVHVGTKALNPYSFLNLVQN